MPIAWKRLGSRLNHVGVPAARCSVKNLMSNLSIRGAVRGRGLVCTTVTDESPVGAATVGGGAVQTPEVS